MQKMKVLIADDSVSIRTLMTDLLSRWGYDVMTCVDGSEAWSILNQEEYFPLLILDWIMPGFSGIDLCQKIRDTPRIANSYIILLTGKSNTEDIICGLNAGADDYLTKPFEQEELRARIKTASRIYNYELELKAKELEVRISCYNALTELAEAREIGSRRENVSRNTESSSHLQRIADLSVLLAAEMGLNMDFQQDLYLFSPMHDIGKIAIPDGILHLPRKYTSIEMEIMKTHCEIGYDVLKDKESLEMAADIAYTHHEKWNGNGYPRGLKGEDIPLAGRIVSVVDVYDALRATRVYKEGYSHVRSIDIMKDEIGRSFDPKIMEVFLSIEDKMEVIFDIHYARTIKLQI